MKIKKIIGIIIIAHLIPCGLIIINILKEGILEYGYLIPYVIGWIFNIIALIMFALIRFCEWCFED